MYPTDLQLFPSHAGSYLSMFHQMGKLCHHTRNSFDSMKCVSGSNNMGRADIHV